MKETRRRPQIRLAAIAPNGDKSTMTKKTNTAGRAGNPISLHPLTPEQAIRGMFQIKPADVKRIVASRPGKRKKK